MTDWTVEQIPGGLAWVKNLTGTAQQWRISLFVAKDGYWHVTSYRTGTGVFSKASFNSRLKTPEGMDQCLEWVQKFLSSNNEPMFDIVGAKQFLLKHPLQKNG